MNPYNMAQGMARAREADRTSIRDPDPLLVIQVSETDFGVVELGGALVYTLQPPAQLPVGFSIMCVASVAGATVEGDTIADGTFRTYRVTKNAAGTKLWAQETDLAD